MQEVKEEEGSDDETFESFGEVTPAEMEAMWLQVKHEIKEETDAEAWPSSAADFSEACIKKEVGSEVRIKQEPLDVVMPKRRRLTERDLRTSAGPLDPVAVKKEAVDQTEVKQQGSNTAFDCKEELTAEEMEALWLEVKQEIKEEVEAEAGRAGQGAEVSWTSVKREVKAEVKVKRELLEEENQDGSFHDSRRKQPALATPKRRRLARRDLETPAKQAVATFPTKQEGSNQVRVKQEVKSEHALQEGPQLTQCKIECDWLEVKLEANEDSTTGDSSVSRAAHIKRELHGLALHSSTVEGITVKKELKDDLATHAKGLPAVSAVKEEELLLEVRSRLEGQVCLGVVSL